MTRRWLFVSVCLLGVSVGCARTVPALPRVYPVNGKVLLANGAPLTMGRVHLHPKDNPWAAEAFGEIQADGSFAITTSQRNDGAVPGTYLVTIEPYSYKTGNLRVLKPFPVPQRFWEVDTSGLTIEVKSGQNSLQPIQLK